MELSEKEAHCVARLLQGAIYGESQSVFNGCTFCKFRCKNEKDPATHFDEIMLKLKAITGVDLGVGDGSRIPFSNFPYRRFLKNSNDEIKSYIYEYFKNCEEFPER